MDKELEEAIKHLKNGKKISIVELLRILKKEGTEKFYFSRKEYVDTALNELERLQKENSKLERANKTYINSIQSITPVLLEDYIEKDKIREKLEELQKEYKEALEENSTKAFILKCQITILEELLEGK